MSQLFKLFELTHRFAGIERSVKIIDRDSMESDAEHSYQLAIMAWYLNNKLKLKLDRQKILEYALCHDLVEVYAGDTNPHTHPKKFIASKHRRETAALRKIRSRFPDFDNLYKTINKFERLGDKESKFIYLLDKILPVINTYLADQRFYYDSKVTYKRWNEWLQEKRKKAGFNQKDFNMLLDEVERFFAKVKPGFFSSL